MEYNTRGFSIFDEERFIHLNLAIGIDQIITAHDLGDNKKVDRLKRDLTEAILLLANPECRIIRDKPKDIEYISGRYELITEEEFYKLGNESNPGLYITASESGLKYYKNIEIFS